MTPMRVRGAGLAEREAAGGVEWRAWRRRLGPVAWVVLEELCDHAAGDGEARVSARSLAGVLGLDKDTVARALRRLTEAGLVVAGSQRRDGGRFGAGRYRLLIPQGGRPASPAPTTTPPPPARRKSPARSRSGRPVPGGQQSLFDHDDLLDSGPRHHQRPASDGSSSDLA